MGTEKKLLRPGRARDDAKIGLYRLLNVPSGFNSREVDDFVDRVIEAAVEEVEMMRGKEVLEGIEEVSIPLVPDDADVESDRDRGRLYDESGPV